MSDSSESRDYLGEILSRKRRELGRRRRHALFGAGKAPEMHRGQTALQALRRSEGEALRVIAEVKFRSPSAGEIRPWRVGEGVKVAKAYADNGASVVSVLADAPGFGGSPQQVRRVAQAIEQPVLYKGFVLDETQVDLAFVLGASLVLLLVRALDDAQLLKLVNRIRQKGMEPVVEAANAKELERAIATSAPIVGVNARDLRTFRIDMEAAVEVLDRVPEDRVAVFMSGVKNRQDFDSIAKTRADAVLMGEVLMRASDPGAKLAEFL